MAVAKQKKPADKKDKILAQTKDYTLTDMAKFHASVNWLALWEEFYLTLHESGRHRFSTVTRFAMHVAKNAKQKEFLQYYLGPKLEDGEEAPHGFNFVNPQDWAHKRESGGWSSGANTRALTKQINHNLRGLDALRAVGNEVTLDHVLRMKHIVKRIDLAFNFGVFPEELPFDKLMLRWHAYMDILERAGKIEDHLVTLYAKTLGMDFSDTQGLVTMLQSGILNSNSADATSQSRTQQVATSLNNLLMVKAAKYKVPLPPDAEKIIDGVATSIPADKNEKPN